MKRWIVLVAALAVALFGCGREPGARRTELVVSAAASMKDALVEAKERFEGEHPDVTVRLNLGSSGSLRQQIVHGAPADLFISASEGHMDALVEQGLVAPEAVRTVASNTVVLIRPAVEAAGGLSGWQDLTGPSVSRIGIGNPAHVPAGMYGQAVLERLGLWEAVQPRLVLGENVRQVLQYVETASVDAGIVYGSDAATSEKVVVVAEAPAGSHPPVRYPMAVLKGAAHPDEAEAFAAYLLSPAGQEVLRAHGFEGVR